jgi:Galactoside-binding lectin
MQRFGEDRSHALSFVLCNSFAVNLRHSDGGDIAFHFNPRLHDRVVVRNTCVGGGWQAEERQQPSFPFSAGQQCNIMILCEQSQLKVTIHGI